MDNTTFFDVIDAEHKAYWLGFYCADGYMFKNLKQVSFIVGGRDRSHLEKFASLFGRGIRETSVWDSRTNKFYASVRCVLSSKHLCQSLLAKGVPQQKTKFLDGAVVDAVPMHLACHFVRGYFDGDGCLSCVGNAEYRLTIVGSRLFLGRVVQIVEEHTQVKSPKQRFQSGVHRVIWTGLERINAIKRWMYQDATVFLERKKVLFDQVPTHRGSSVHKGIYWSKSRQKWLARYYRNGRMKTLGQFNTEQEAYETLRAFQEHMVGFDTATPQLISDFAAGAL